MERVGGPPTPGQWLAGTLESNGRSRAQVGQMIGRSREEVTRWATGREQIPRIHLLEIASQLAPTEVDYVLRLKDCEDARDRVLREARSLARISATAGAEDVVRRLTAALDGSMQSIHLSPSDEAVGWVKNLSAAVFAIRTWADFLQGRGRTPLISSANVSRHLQYPVNLLIGTLLEEDRTAETDSVNLDRELALEHLRKVVEGTEEAAAVPLIRQHALHLLARYGDARDRVMVTHLLSSDTRSADPLSRKLGYCGLMMSAGGGQEAADEFVYYLSRDDDLADVDLAFDATHYGDQTLTGANTLRRPDGNHFIGLATNIAKHYENPQRYGTLADADAFRLLKILDLRRLTAVTPDVQAMLTVCLDTALIPQDGGTFTRLLRRRLYGLFRSVEPADDRRRPPILRSTGQRSYDAFLAYRTADRSAVIAVAAALRDLGRRCWLDVWEMIPGQLVQTVMEQAVVDCRAAVIFLGSSLGKWERLEYVSSMTLFVERGSPVIPVILEGREMPASTPPFLREFHGVYVDDHATPEAVARAICRGLPASA